MIKEYNQLVQEKRYGYGASKVCKKEKTKSNNII